jgi:hypothetical protein
MTIDPQRYAIVYIFARLRFVEIGRAPTMQQIAEWLAELGLSQYAHLFDENGIDFGVLAYLTDQDLEKLGVLLGHRRKLLHSIANLSGIESGAHHAH